MLMMRMQMIEAVFRIPPLLREAFAGNGIKIPDTKTLTIFKMWNPLLWCKDENDGCIWCKIKTEKNKASPIHQLVHISSVMQLCCKKITNYISK